MRAESASPRLRRLLPPAARSVLLFCAAFAFAAGARSSSASAQEPGASRDLPPAFRSVAGVVLNVDSALSIREKLGLTRETIIGAGHNRFLRWCYVSSDSTLLELLSDSGEMGTRSHSLNVIELTAKSSRAQRAGCAALRAPAPIAIGPGLHLGARASQFIDALGKPASRKRHSLVFHFSSKEFMKPGTAQYAAWNTPERRASCFGGGEPYSWVNASVTVRLAGGRASAIRVDRYDQATC